ncbi:MAG: hypothetical protein WDW38_010909 [Sanguina aurantia]
MAMEIDKNSFQLRCELNGHLEDVGHTDYVGPLLAIPPAIGEDGVEMGPTIASGSRDTTIIVWDPITATALHTLKGHTYQVTGLARLPSGEIVSASLDNKCTAVLEGHAGPVLCVVVLPASGRIVSGSGDDTIKMWDGASCVATIKGHTDTVRALAALPEGGFVSASHDMSLRVWSEAGVCGGVLQGHTAIVYSVTALLQGMLASCSEDNTVRVWNSVDRTCLQVIPHPACIWDVSFTPEGDLLTACADAMARVWTCRPGKEAPPEVAAAYAAAMAEQQAGKGATADAGVAGDASASGLPDGLKVEESFSLQQPGSKEGQQKFVREEGGSVCLYCWDAAEFRWDKVGEVMSAAEAKVANAGGGTMKKLHAGKEWDFVFDVAMEDGEPALKLALNAGDNPYLVADAFLELHGLPASFKDQVVQFIFNGTGEGKGGSRAGLENFPITGGFCDPFTGRSGGPSANPRASLGSQMGEFGGNNGFSSITGGGMDPLTGGSGSSSSRQQQQQQQQASTSASGPPAHTLLHCPATAYLAFDNAPNVDALRRKLHEFNALLRAQVLPLSDEEMAAPLEALLSKLAAGVTASGPSSATFNAADVAVLMRLLTWPAAYIFPALDIARVVVLDAAGARLVAARAGSLYAAVNTATARSSATTSPANLQLACRLVANGFKHEAMREWVDALRSELFDSLSPALSCTAKAVRLSAATMLLNFSVQLRRSAGAEDDMQSRLQVLSAAAELLGGCPALEDPDSTFRTLQALGTVLSGDATLAGLAADLGVQDHLRNLNNTPGIQRRVLEAAIDVMAAISTATNASA